jgi:hypothetical protein
MRHSVERVKTSLQIDEDIDLHIRSWVGQRIGWALMFALLISAALGLFGNGALSEMKVSSNGAFLSYERFSRYESNTALEIEASGMGGSISVRLDPEFSRSFKVEKINPEPSGQSIQDGTRIDSFMVGGRGHITYFISPRTRGRSTYTMRVNDSEFRLTQYIYP